MTDKREELIAEAADAIARERGYVQGACLDEHYRDARAALAVFEQAHATQAMSVFDIDHIIIRAARDYADQIHFTRGAGDDEDAYEQDYARAKAEMHEAVLAHDAEKRAEWEVEQGEVEYMVNDGEGALWALTDDLAEARHYAMQEPGAQVLTRNVSPWVPVNENGETP